MSHAIFLRGAIRTWNHNKKSIIDFFNLHHNNPDWYICFWNSGSSDKQQVEKDLKNCNVKFLHFEDSLKYQNYRQLNNRNDAYWRLAYLDHLLSMAKRTNEINDNIRYKTVTFIRPDVRYESVRDNHANLLDEIKHLEVVCQDVANRNNSNNTVCSLLENYFVNDLIVIAGEIAADIYGTRFVDIDYTEQDDPNIYRYLNWDPHQMMASIQSKYQLFNKKHYIPINPTIIRPNNVVSDQSSNWNILDNDTKIKMCRNLNIDLHDYQLAKKPQLPSSL
jgi:hypothetical protein